MRPARCRELEQQLAIAQERLENNPDEPSALATLRDWYAFRGRDVPLSN